MSDATSDATLRQAEAIVLDLTHRLTCPSEGECLYCFVARMLDEHGCDNTLRWAARFRDLRAPRAKALEERLGRMGGFCDCEIFLNGVGLAQRARPEEHAWWEEDDEDEEDEDGPEPADRRPACLGVRAGSTQGCGQWARLGRW